ncbi:MAG: cytochrome c oxidase subunit 3 [Candidatus Pedobacter colombiensis]|uniref:Cytochrome c oxidase subunit 3 n=1 Tax=Candidatus Pedobacter colombiensis TaxID=3121371 RepID=A0AAJ5WBT6_9SPHI|nr:cytochrome c oxidase subunit 3 [Pedobacter sp.]WEK21579.1 MAG: cytochrome c oxidase subunit 3 [Pedobacter sp.]
MDNKLMIKLIVGTEAMFFLALIMAFVYFSLVPGFRTHQLVSLDIKSTGVFSLFLFSSSFTYWRAEENFRKGDVKHLKVWLLLTILLGVIFLFGQGKEYYDLLNHQVTISSSTFGTSFFTLTGFHGLHVLIGLIVIAVLTCLAFLGDYDQPGSSLISMVGIYWHFVDIVWVFVFLIVYVLPFIVR